MVNSSERDLIRIFIGRTLRSDLDIIDALLGGMDADNAINQIEMHLKITFAALIMFMLLIYLYLHL